MHYSRRTFVTLGSIPVELLANIKPKLVRGHSLVVELLICNQLMSVRFRLAPIAVVSKEVVEYSARRSSSLVVEREIENLLVMVRFRPRAALGNIFFTYSSEDTRN